MYLIHLFDGLTTQDSILILSALGLAYLLGIFSMQGYLFNLRKKKGSKEEELVRVQKELKKVKAEFNESPAGERVDLLQEPILEYMDDEKTRFALLQKEFNSFKNDFQDSIEFYVHSIEELSESNHELARKVKALELENEQLVKAVWSDDQSFQSFSHDLMNSQPFSNDSVNQEPATEIAEISIQDDEVQESTNNIKNWIRAQKMKENNQDNLTEIKGISKSIERRINEIGITSYRQMSMLDDALIDDLAKAINYFSGRIKKEDWVGQAYRLEKGGTA
ncbi:MAG TPA: hypothetical protein ENK85_07450 [Saprospiraceae bacterium]|nr:hypothetical protein [Saprospiraceae bacterium]